MKVIEFYTHEGNLDEIINTWLKKGLYSKIIDIKYAIADIAETQSTHHHYRGSSTSTRGGYTKHSALIIYEEKEVEDEN